MHFPLRLDLLPEDQRVWTAFCKIFSGIPHSTILSVLKYAPQIWYLAIFGRVFECAWYGQVGYPWKNPCFYYYSKTPLWPPSDYLVTTWWLLEDCLVSTWRPLGDHVVTTWWPLGDHLVTTWWPISHYFVKSVSGPMPSTPILKLRLNFLKSKMSTKGRGVGGFVDPVH